LNSTGKKNFKEHIDSMLSRGRLEISEGPQKGKFVPLKIVDLGDNGFVYSTAHQSTLVFQKDNQYQYTMTLYRNVPESDVFNGLNKDSPVLEACLVALAKSM
jgi:hypothetical protein